VARSIDEYVRIALRLAGNPVALAHARHGLRDLLRATPLLDHRGVTRDLEAAYRAMWRTWCASALPASVDRSSETGARTEQAPESALGAPSETPERLVAGAL
jgi:hypothetical protein